MEWYVYFNSVKNNSQYMGKKQIFVEKYSKEKREGEREPLNLKESLSYHS